MIVCAAIVGPLNNPIYLRCFIDEGFESTLKFHYIIHCSLDAVEEKVMMPRKHSTADSNDAYLGLLYPTEDYKVYGYVSNTNTKFIMVFDDISIKEEDIKLIFKRFHNAYVNASSNPFYTFGEPLKSPIFEFKMKALSKGVAT